MPSLSCVMLCLAVAKLFSASLRYAVAMRATLCLAVAVRICAVLCPALPCNATPLLCCALPCPRSASPCFALAVQCYAALCYAAPCIALAQLIAFWQYADFLSACVRLPADLFRVKRLTDRAFLHLADYVPPLDAVGHCVSPLSAPSDGACRVFTPLGM